MKFNNTATKTLCKLARWTPVFFIGLSLLGMNDSFGQMKPNLNHYLFNYYLINPAVVGIEDYIDVKSSIRSQWNGLEGSPETFLFTIHGNIVGKTKQNPANPQKPKNDGLGDYTVDLRGYNARPHHGVGGYVMADKVGPFSKYQVSGSFAYHIPLSKKYRLSAGVSLGMVHNRLDREKITLHDPNDLAISGEKYTNTNPDLGFGLWFYSRKFFLGASGNQLFKYTIGYSDQALANAESFQHYIFTSGYKVIFNQNFLLTPSVTFKFMEPMPLVIDYNLSISMIDRVSVALTYRNTEEYVLGVRFVASPVFEFGYFFDYGGAAIDRYNSGSHEIYVGIRLRNKGKILCPVII